MVTTTLQAIRFNSRSPRSVAHLSTFSHAPFTLRLKVGTFRFRNAEAAYQLLKAEHITRELALHFSQLEPGRAAYEGKRLRIRKDWSTKRYEAMAYVLAAKYEQNPWLVKLLLETGDTELEHLAPWDTHWGVDQQGRGENWLGRMLMIAREHFREQA